MKRALVTQIYSKDSGKCARSFGLYTHCLWNIGTLPEDKEPYPCPTCAFNSGTGKEGI